VEVDPELMLTYAQEKPDHMASYSVSDAVKLIRGSSKGSEVRLTVKRIDGSIHVIKIIRDEVKLDNTFAKSAIINGKNKIGYIYLPEFYADFERPNGARCAVDIAKEIEKLKAENVSGIILDLRGNGGGSLYDVVQMAGLFIKNGPVCQVKGRDESPNILKDKDDKIQYTGPLAVMVDGTSASASEIFAAAIQDYKRGIIIGANSTYGKGTVQSTIDVSRIISPTDKLMLLNEKQEENGKNGTVARQNAPQFGQINLTMAKFYRVNGSSTQHKGVLPDIQFPMIYPADKYGESAEPAALAWDTVKPSKYSPVANLTAVNASLVKLHEQRMKTSEEYAYLLDDIANFRKKEAETSVSVNEATLKADREAQEAKNLARENKRRASRGLAPLKKGEVKASDDFDFIEEESLKIIADFISLKK
jgi:carboxyl-terminal processing protease